MHTLLLSLLDARLHALQRVRWFENAIERDLVCMLVSMGPRLASPHLAVSASEAGRRYVQTLRNGKRVKVVVAARYG
jgi:hypothetical protein